MLPEIKKTIIYLDTSTVSNMASAIRKRRKSSPWIKLYESLRQGAEDEVLCGVASCVLETEAELSVNSNEIISLSKEFADPNSLHELDIRHAQLFRALERFLADQDAVLETDLPWSDAFGNDPHAWQELFRIEVSMKASENETNKWRTSKEDLRGTIEEIYGRYSTESSFCEIRNRESSGFGRGIMEDGLRSIRGRIAAIQTGNTDNILEYGLATTFDLIVQQIRQNENISGEEAVDMACKFLQSDHVRKTPMAVAHAELHAAMAVAMRGPKGRKPKASDVADIDHIAKTP